MWGQRCQMSVWLEIKEGCGTSEGWRFAHYFEFIRRSLKIWSFLSFVGIRKGLFADVCVYCVEYVHVWIHRVCVLHESYQGCFRSLVCVFVKVTDLSLLFLCLTSWPLHLLCAACFSKEMVSMILFWDASETCCSASAGCDRLQWSHDSQCPRIWHIPSVRVCQQGRDPQKLLKDWKVEFVCFSWSVNDVIIFHQFDTSNSSKCCFWITVIFYSLNFPFKAV